MDTSMRNRLLAGFIALMVVLIGGSSGYWLIGDGRWTWDACLYMTVITLTTVGYGETLTDMEHVPYARAFTIVQLVFGTGVLVYFVSTITAFIVEGDLKNILKAQRLRKRIRRMKDHVIVCGVGSTGRHILRELIATRTPVVAIDLDELELREVADSAPGADLSYVVGDATDDEVLAQAGLGVARGLVAALASDKDNLFLVVSARQSNPTARIVTRCAELAHVEKLRKAGADSVVSPNFIGGMRIAAEMLRPAVVRFLDEMLRDKTSAYRIEEIEVTAGGALDGVAVRDARVREQFGMSVLAVRAAAGTPWLYNPEPTQVLGAGAILVVLGTVDQVQTLRKHAAR
jgi:voltage-gated potassium channel